MDNSRSKPIRSEHQLQKIPCDNQFHGHHQRRQENQVAHESRTHGNNLREAEYRGRLKIGKVNTGNPKPMVIAVKIAGLPSYVIVSVSALSLSRSFLNPLL